MCLFTKFLKPLVLLIFIIFNYLMDNFHTAHGVLKARILKWFASPVDHILSDLSTMTHPFGWPYRAWLSFIELDKAVVLV